MSSDGVMEGESGSGPRCGAHPVSAEPIDAVYLWVDGAAPETRERLRAAIARRPPDQLDAVDEARFRDHGELRYSLRSLEQFAPWIRRVHVVTDGAPPPWLHLDERCVHVTHDQIFPAGCLPTFNSCAIELQLHRIPGLSRRFLYFNDDLFLGREVGREEFLLADGRQIVHLDGCEMPPEGTGSATAQALAYTARVTVGRLGPETVVQIGAHAPRLFDRELLQAIEALWPEDHRRTSGATFRSPTDLALQVLYPAAAVAGVNDSVPAIPRLLPFWSPEYSFVEFTPDPSQSLVALLYVERTRSRFICINDHLGRGPLTDQLSAYLQTVLERMYPLPSRYEIT